MINSSFWRGKRVFITGHSGFKGGWLAFWLHQHGAVVTGYSLPPPTNPSFFEVVGLSERVQSKFDDVANLDSLRASLAASNAEIVFHMAAQPLVRASYKDPVGTYRTNVMGTVHLLEAVRSVKSVRSCVVVTTDKCYENKEWIWGYRENDRLGGRDPYSNSKACSELVTSAYLRSFFDVEAGVGVASARAGNVIGGGDFAEDRLIPDLIRSQLNKSDLVIRYPHATRPWQHVLVPLSGYVVLAQELYNEPKKYSEAFNFGPPDRDCISVESVLTQMSTAWGARLPVRLEKNQQPHEAKLLKLDISKADTVLKWKPVWEIEETIRKTAEWYKLFVGAPSNSKNNILVNLTQVQIQEFENKWKSQTKAL